MTQAIRIQTINEGVAGIRDEYIIEAETTPKPIHITLIRIAAAAAVFTLLASIPFLVQSPVEETQPLFLITVSASQVDGPLHTPDYYFNEFACNHPSYHSNIPVSQISNLFDGQPFFEFQIRYTRNDDAFNEYDLIITDTETGLPFESESLIITRQETTHRKSFVIRGCLKEETALTFTLKDLDGNIIQYHDLVIGLDDSGYYLDVIRTTV